MKESFSSNRPWHLVSFPRSGNHLLRGLLEYASGRKTLGCPGAKNNGPIFSKEPNQLRKIIVVDDRRPPVALKSHFSTEIWRHQKKHSAQGCILIIRNPVDAITSHLMRGIKSERDLALSDYGREIEHLQRAYLHLLYVYRSYPEHKRILVRFEELISSPERAASITSAIGQKMCEEFAALDLGTTSSVFEVTKESQRSLKNSDRVVEKIVKAAVRARISHNEINKFLENGH